MNAYFALLVNRAASAPAALEKAATAANTVVTPIVTQQVEPAKALVNTCQEPLATAILHAVQIVVLGADYHCTAPQHSLGVSLLNVAQAIAALTLTVLVAEVGIAYNTKVYATAYKRLAATLCVALIICYSLWGMTGLFVTLATLIGGFLFWAICSDWLFIPGILLGLKLLEDSFYLWIPRVATFFKEKATNLIAWIKSLIPEKADTFSDEETPSE